MKKRIPLRKYINKLSDAHQVLGLKFYIPEEIINANLIIREIHLDNIEYNDEWKMVYADIEAFVEPIDENLPIPKIDQ